MVQIVAQPSPPHLRDEAVGSTAVTVTPAPPSAVSSPADIALEDRNKSENGTILAISNGSAPAPPSTEAPEALDNIPQVGHSHFSHRAGWLRAMVLGANDGLVSTASLMMGVSGGQTDLNIMILTGLAGMGLFLWPPANTFPFRVKKTQNWQI